MKIMCVCCERDLKELGALMFGPPRNIALGTAEVAKLHVCVDCWDWVLHLMLKRPKHAHQKGLK